MSAKKNSVVDMYPEIAKTLSFMRTENKGEHFVAACVADIHLSETPPRARAEEKDWITKQRDKLLEVAQICNELQVQLFITGDIFDTAFQPPPIINMSICAFRVFDCRPIAIPGNHDMPYHNKELVKNSAIKTLELSSAVYIADSLKDLETEDIISRSFWYGDELEECKFPEPDKFTEHDKLRVALCHQYVWPGNAMAGYIRSKHMESEKNSTLEIMQSGKGLHWDVMLFGDNHQPFISAVPSTKSDYGSKIHYTLVGNPGCLIPRTLAEVGTSNLILVTNKGNLKLIRLDTNTDVWTYMSGDVEKIETGEQIDIQGFQSLIDMVKQKHQTDIDFKQELQKEVSKIKAPLPLRKMILECLEVKCRVDY